MRRQKRGWQTSSVREGDAGGPLQGVRVVELGGGIPAAFAAHQLGGFGAEVVRVEGDDAGPLLTDDETSYLLAGKRRVDADGLDVRRLVLVADILVEDGRPGRLSRRGLTPAELRSEKPSMVIVSITPFG